MTNINKTITHVFLLISFFYFQDSHSQKAAKTSWQKLFNGKDFTGWYLKIKSGDAELAKKVYAIEDGMVHVFNNKFPDTITLKTGENATHGLFYTKKKYSKYILRFEYKWGSKIANNFQDWQYDAGAYYHVYDDMIWPKGLEYQVRYNHLTKTNHTGDLIKAGVDLKWYANNDKQFCLPKNGGVAKTYDDWMYKGANDVKFNALNNQWNQCEIIVMGNEYVIHKLNGTIVNMATNLSVSEGIIGFQSETAEIYYRNIQIKEFDKTIPMDKFLK